MPVISVTRGCSSVGRAPALQAGGHEFESHHLHSDTYVSGCYILAYVTGSHTGVCGEHIENCIKNKIKNKP